MGLSATGACENVTLPAVKGECLTRRIVAKAERKTLVVSVGYLSCLLKCRRCLMRLLMTRLRQPGGFPRRVLTICRS
jgi:hypothetical protein